MACTVVVIGAASGIGRATAEQLEATGVSASSELSEKINDIGTVHLIAALRPLLSVGENPHQADRAAARVVGEVTVDGAVGNGGELPAALPGIFLRTTFSATPAHAEGRMNDVTMTLDDFLAGHPVDRANVEAHKDRMLAEVWAHRPRELREQRG